MSQNHCQCQDICVLVNFVTVLKAAGIPVFANCDFFRSFNHAVPIEHPLSLGLIIPCGVNFKVWNSFHFLNIMPIPDINLREVPPSSLAIPIITLIRFLNDGEVALFYFVADDYNGIV